MIKAIETEYLDHRFRSRLEARWAAFFNEAGIDWHYEPEGFEDPGAGFRYLPDFYLPKVNGGVYFEVKGTFMDDTKTIDDDVSYLHNVSRVVPKPLVFAIGPFPRPDLIWYAQLRPADEDTFGYMVGIPLEFGNATRLFNRDRRGDAMWILFKEAYQTAARARFEHGERP